MRKFGLVGYPLGHSFSKKYFTQKFHLENIQDAEFELFELPDVQELTSLIAQNPDLKGLSVTIPHKQNVIPLLNEVDETAAKIGAVNCIKISVGKLTGYNTDYIGFRESLKNFLPADFKSQALILGCGGAAKAVKATLQELEIPFIIVSRNPVVGDLHYNELTPEIIEIHQLIINTTPLGTFPEIETCPEIPYQDLSPHHYLFDLVYNPEETLFMKKGKEMGAKTKNGYEMLVLQAEAAWLIWNS